MAVSQAISPVHTTSKVAEVLSHEKELWTGGGGGDVIGLGKMLLVMVGTS